jgi:hypothetical protein
MSAGGFGVSTQTMLSRFWSPTLTVKDPQIPYLPLETEEPDVPPPGGVVPLRSLMGVGL